MCVYDAAGVLLGGSVLHGAPGWRRGPVTLSYNDPLSTRRGLNRIKMRFHPTYGVIQVKGRGAGLGVPSLPAAFPVTAQLVNLDSGACWASTFPTFKRNASAKVVAKIP
jgi:hypothetical protein